MSDAQHIQLKEKPKREAVSIPLKNFLPKTYPISSIKQETEHVKTLTFPVTFNAKPGQFLMIWLPGVDEVPMSIAFDDGKKTKVRFFDVGDMTKALFKLKEGTLVGLRGPFGTHYEWEKKQHLILVAGGYRLNSLQIIDQFRFSSHVEIVAGLERG